ncbi:i[[h]] channel isoform e [Holotrichia oblita]|uniref:I[[h]] channel isoform e n=1 Tax=Holotrichia oblita TaxID=644536 RepID=A0ACB9TM97_HOLOL|nr:i[[h]] channel isoform e [Holotrichia oblita]
MHQAQMHPEFDNLNNTLVKKYLNCLLTAMSHFYRIGSKTFDTRCVGDYIVLAGIMIFGAIYFAYIIVTVLQAVGTANASESKYEELMRQIYHYLRTKKMPHHTHLRLQMYYEHRFQKRYFREQSILSTLSEHLRYEIKLCTSKHLIGKVAIFKGLSKSAIGSIIGGLTLEVYLANDVIVQNGTLVDSWYIISYGTVAIIHKSGAEISHIQDGECFGEISIITGVSDINFVATEISEIFYMSKSDFLKYLSHESINKKITDIIAEREFKINLSLEKTKYQSQEREEVLYKVRRGKILQKGYPRHHMTE